MHKLAYGATQTRPVPTPLLQTLGPQYSRRAKAQTRKRPPQYQNKKVLSLTNIQIHGRNKPLELKEK